MTMNIENEKMPGISEVLEAAAHSLEMRKSSSQSIARMHEHGGALAPVQLEQRRMIHREESVRPQADAFREIRTRLLAMAGQQNFVTLVVAVSPRSGGSFVARNLAAAFAFDDAKTSLLIDCNVRYPSQHKAMGIEATRGGLTDLMDHPAIGVETILYHTGVPHLRLIPAGSARESGSEYFTSFRMRTVIDSLRSRYADRYLFLDGPAIKGAPDARILADLADFVVVVAGYGKDTPGAITQALTHFEPSKLAGVVFNQAQ